MTETTKNFIKKKVKAHIPKDCLKEFRILYRIMLETFNGIKRTGWINLVIVTTMVAILTIFGSLFRTTLSLNSFVDKLSNVLEISVYLKTSANPDEVAKEIRKTYHNDAKKIPIIAITADAYGESLNEIKEAGMDTYISKPIDVNRLLKILEHNKK